MTVEPWVLFLCGFAGSGTIEVLALVRQYKMNSALPAHYYRRGYWLVRSLLAFAGGGFATLLAEMPAPLLAAISGAFAPSMIEAIAQLRGGVRAGNLDAIELAPPPERSGVAAGGDP